MIRLEKGSAGDHRFKVVGWEALEQAQSEATDLTAAQWQGVFAVYVDKDPLSKNSDLPAILGTYRIEDGILIFQPRFPLERGLRYRAIFNPVWPPTTAQSGVDLGVKESIVATFLLPKPEVIASTRVEQVYPSSDLLPENQLKLYLHFSAPMSRGEAYRWIRLLDDTGTQVGSPFLELDEELWDREGKRLTVLFDPGRIKRGLLPYEEVGPPIEEGKKYTLVIDRHWLDAKGVPLKEGYEKSFRVRAPDKKSPDLKDWWLVPPHDGTSEPLVVEFPEPMDHALLFRLLEVMDKGGNAVQGFIQVDGGETQWRFIPKKPWKVGDYSLVVRTTLEDLAGNRIDRLFEVDRFEKVEEQIDRGTVALPFKIQLTGK